MQLTERMRDMIHALAPASLKEQKVTWSLWRSRLKHSWRENWSVVSHVRFYAAATIASVFLTAFSVLAMHHMHQAASWVRVFSQGNYVGMVPNNPSVLSKMQRIADGYHVELTLTPIHTAVSSNYDWRSVTTLPTQAAVIELNGRPIVYTQNTDVAKTVLSDVKHALLPNNLKNKDASQFVGVVTISQRLVSVANILDEVSAVRYILNPNPQTIAARSESVSNLLGIQGPKIVTDIHHSLSNPLIQLATETTIIKTVNVPYQTKYINDNGLGSGSVSIVTHGRSGVARETVKERFVNGKLVTQTVMSKDIVKKPVVEVAKKGTNSGVASGSWQWPCGAYDITSPFGARDLDGVYGFHPGVDIGCSVGTPIYASNNGYVEDAGWNDGGYGIWVKINNGNGIETVFGHMSSVAVHSGELVTKGELIGYSGQTGFATGPHLHYEVRLNGTAINPSPYM